MRGITWKQQPESLFMLIGLNLRIDRCILLFFKVSEVLKIFYSFF